MSFWALLESSQRREKILTFEIWLKKYLELPSCGKGVKLEKILTFEICLKKSLELPSCGQGVKLVKIPFSWVKMAKYANISQKLLLLAPFRVSPREERKFLPSKHGLESL